MEKLNLAQITADRLRALIQEENAYQAGEKLPNENVLSKELGISRTTLREAIRILVSDGLLYVERGRGTFIKDKLSQSTSTTFVSSNKDIKVTLRDLYETRMIFEPEAAALACKRASQEEIQEILRLGNICQQYILDAPKGKERIASEAAFHGAILKACHNEFLSEFIPIVNETIEKTFALQVNLDVIAEDAYKDHVMIMNFLEKRDAEALKSAVLIHLHHAVWNENLNTNE